MQVKQELGNFIVNYKVTERIIIDTDLVEIEASFEFTINSQVYNFNYIGESGKKYAWRIIKHNNEISWKWNKFTL